MKKLLLAFSWRYWGAFWAVWCGRVHGFANLRGESIMLGRFAEYFGFIRKSTVSEKLQFARSVGKRLDEHREVVESLEVSGFFNDKWWHVGHMATQDDYLMRLYYMVYKSWPNDDAEMLRQLTGEYVRPRPKILGPCRLPEFAGTY